MPPPRTNPVLLPPVQSCLDCHPLHSVLGGFGDEVITFKLRKMTREMHCTRTCNTKWSERRARGPEVGEHVWARFYPPKVPLPCFLATAQLDCRWGSSSINPIPLKERRKKNKQKNGGFRISLLSPEALQWKVLPFRPIDVIAIIEDSRPPRG